jgi:signal transduction histidine kinase
MKPSRRRLRPGADLPFHRLAAILLVVAAMGPIALLGFLVHDQVERSLAKDAVARTDRAVDAANAEVGRASRELDGLIRSYADWSAFADQVRGGNLEAVRVGVLEFLVERGSVAGGILRSPAGTVAAGPAALTATIGAADGPSSPGPRFLTLGGQVYLVDEEPVRGDGPTELGRLLLARTLDARFVADVAGFTGFAVAVLAADGTVAVTTDASVTGAAIASTTGLTDTVVRTGDVIGRRVPLGDGSTGEQLVLATRVSALQAAAGTLPFLILALLGATGVVAILMAVGLSAVLRRRLGVVHDGLIAVADGRVPPTAPDHGAGDDIARLSDGLERLVRTLDRREATVRRCLEAAAAIPINTSPREAAGRLATATVEIFGVAWCRLSEADGGRLAAAGSLPETSEPATAPVAEAPLGLGSDGRLLEIGSLRAGTWADGDQAGLEVMGLLAGSVLGEVEAYGRAMGRADRLDRLNRLQREFLRSISHNLRAPLATIELAASDLEDLAASPFVRERAEAIRMEERRLARLVNQVLILSRMETGTLELDGEPVALPALARRIAAELGIRERVELLDRGGSVAFADQAATEQIAWILLDNAARYAPEGRIHVEIGPGPPGPEPSVVLAVEDEGPGVQPDERRRIFQRFVRGRAGREAEGTGLGLSVARGLARSLGGDVTCRPGLIGARFEVRLPGGGIESGGGDPDGRGAGLPDGHEPGPVPRPGRLSGVGWIHSGPAR